MWLLTASQNNCPLNARWRRNKVLINSFKYNNNAYFAGVVVIWSPRFFICCPTCHASTVIYWMMPHHTSTLFIYLFLFLLYPYICNMFYSFLLLYTFFSCIYRNSLTHTLNYNLDTALNTIAPFISFTLRMLCSN